MRSEVLAAMMCDDDYGHGKPEMRLDLTIAA